MSVKSPLSEILSLRNGEIESNTCTFESKKRYDLIGLTAKIPFWHPNYIMSK